MSRSIHIRGYRGFENFEMGDLKRVNLLVGTNNSGKTSLLEAIYILMSRGDPSALWHVLWRRGERGPERRERPPEVDVSHLFYGHDAHVGSEFALSADNQKPPRSVSFRIIEAKGSRVLAAARERLSQRSEQVSVPSRLSLQIKGHPEPPLDEIPLTRSFGLDPESFGAPARARRKTVTDDEIPAQFVTAESLDSDDLVSLWDKVALTPNENRVLTALKFLDHDIERVAAQASAHYYGARGGFIVKLQDSDHPLPIGSMGDGMWRMMAIAIAIANCRGGVLLIDEIDTGLHYTVLENMWTLVFGAARELDVQVFATTHSSDCIKSLAELCETEADVAENVTLQRIERRATKSVPYSAKEIEVAAEKQIEVR